MVDILWKIMSRWRRLFFFFFLGAFPQRGKLRKKKKESRSVSLCASLIKKLIAWCSKTVEGSVLCHCFFFWSLLVYFIGMFFFVIFDIIVFRVVRNSAY